MVRIIANPSRCINYKSVSQTYVLGQSSDHAPGSKVGLELVI